MGVTGSVAGSTVVVTGAGRGIGRAVAHRFAEHGARVVVSDRHADRAGEVAAEIGGIPLTADATAGVVPAARDLLGTEIDVFCANAGFVGYGGPERPDDIWARSWETNVMSHVRAARDLLPAWTERGDGRFISVVSSAGLLTMLGAGPYAVTKHAAVSFAEWMALTYRHRGVRVHAVCPRGVTTELHRSAASALPLSSSAIGPFDVADAVMRGVAEERFLILPQPEVADHLQSKMADHEEWLDLLNTWQQASEQR